MKSKALEVNMACTRVDVSVSERYDPLREITAGYTGLLETLDAFLREVCHPYRNWAFVVQEARKVAVDTFHLLRVHPKGGVGLGLYVDIWLEASMETVRKEVKKDAVDNLLFYLRKVIKESGEALPALFPAVNEALDRLSCLEEDLFQFVVRSYYDAAGLAADLLQRRSEETGFLPVNRLLVRALRSSYSTWLGEEDPRIWFFSRAGIEEGDREGLEEVFRPVSHTTIQEALRAVKRLEEGDPDSRGLCEALIGLPRFRSVVHAYEDLPGRLGRMGHASGEDERWKLLILFRIMDVEGLSSLWETTLREMHRTMSGLLERETPEGARQALQTAFSVLRRSIRSYPSTALNSLLQIGKAVVATGRKRLILRFVENASTLGFQGPDLGVIGDAYLSRENTAHLQNIRIFMELIALDPRAFRKLLSCLTIHLALEGVFIRDVDLFPRDITSFLQSDIHPVYHQVKQMARLLPTYFNEIGAEGRLRDATTQLDELLGREDALVHFLRKQSHVESSNRIVGLVEGVLSYWWTGSSEPLRPYVPSNMVTHLEDGRGFPEGIHRILVRLEEMGRLSGIEDLLALDNEEVRKTADGLDGVADTDTHRLELAAEVYQLLHQKYRLGTVSLRRYLDQVPRGTFPDPNALEKALSEPDPHRKISGLLDYMERLRDIILSPEAYEVREDIYHKRHIAADIPSVYGTYHEAKFDALGLTLRLEILVNSLLEDLATASDMGLVTWSAMARAIDDLKLIQRALALDGIHSRELEDHLLLLERALAVRGFAFGQFVDLFRGMEEAVRGIVEDAFSNTYAHHVSAIVERLSPEDILTRYRPSEGTPDGGRAPAHRVLEIFLRERIASTPGLQSLDVLVSRIAKTLSREARKLPEESLRALLDFDPEKAVSPIHPVRSHVADPIYLGSKAMNLVRLREYGFPVPPGFVVTTEVFRCRDVIQAYPPANEVLRNRIDEEMVRLEEITGRRYGSPQHPLLLSVRSGAAMSQPGMMETVLNVGINEEIVRGMAAKSGNAWFAWDCYRRFLQSYGMAFGMDRNAFDDLIHAHKERARVTRKALLRADQMEALAVAYRELLGAQGVEPEDDLREQLFAVIWKVMASWNRTRAAGYRRILGISDQWGTAVTVQQMVYGNLSSQAGAGVLFTHSSRWPGEEPQPWGDFTTGNQGEDMVSGIVNTLPLTRRQAELEQREDQSSLEEMFPQVFEGLMDWIEDLMVHRGWGPQDMEFTFEGPEKKDLYVLQTRNLHLLRADKIPRFAPDSRANARLMGRGVGAGGGAMAGRAVYNLDEIQAWRKKEPATPLILIRGDTVPEDIEEIHASDGLLTARGGATSHAAIVAYGLGKTCVVGMSDLICNEKDSFCSMGSFRLAAGEWVSIDGRDGSVYVGMLDILPDV